MSRVATIVAMLLALVILFGWDARTPLDASLDGAAALTAALTTSFAVQTEPPSQELVSLEVAPLIAPVLKPSASDVPAAPALAAEDDNALFAPPDGSPVVDAAVAAAPTRVEQAHAQLEAQGQHFTLIVVSAVSQGLELSIYRDLRTRRYRSTAGPDEGFDTRGQACFPKCVYVPVQEVNVLAVSTWVRVLRHEIRHMIQAAHNSTLAGDFKQGGLFTSYGMFSEVCADDGINVGVLYHAAYRMGALRAWLGRSRFGLIDQACGGDKAAYANVVSVYNRIRRSSRAFALLFPRYR